MNCFKKSIAKGILYVLATILTGNIARAQHFADSLIVLEGVEVEATRLYKFSAGSQVFVLDSTLIRNQAALSMGELLARFSPVFIKSYGEGSLATTTVRGMGASHTAVLWNGMPIQSPMNGQIDFSLLPVNLVDKALLQMGGEGALWGSGAVGGTLYLQNDADFRSGWRASIAQTVGSFDKHFQSYNLSHGGEKWHMSVKVFQNKSENDFPFNNRAKFDTPRENMAHAAFLQRGLLVESYLKLNTKQQLAMRFWGQDNDREIPATLTENSSSAKQQDSFGRYLLTWSGYHNKIDWKIQSGLSAEKLLFTDFTVAINSLSKSKALINEAELNWQLHPNVLLQGGMQHQWLSGSNENYSDSEQTQHRGALFTSFKYQSINDKVQARLSVRQELSEYENAPLVPTLGIVYRPLSAVQFTAKVGRSYRLPTFNDLFWQPGGNPDLLPELGWSQEIGLRTQLPFKTLKSTFSVTAFSNRIDNWILWRPGRSFWSPENVFQVWARGIESNLKLSHEWQETTLTFNLNYHITKSTVEKSYEGSSLQLGKQLIYTPLHTGNASFTFKKEAFSISWQQQYTGSRFSTSDNNSSLSAFTTGNIITSYTWQHKWAEIALQANVYNVTNEIYEAIAWRPMPGRNFQFGIIINPKFNN